MKKRHLSLICSALLACSLWSQQGVAATPPANDFYTSATGISTATGSVSQSLAGATVENLEPLYDLVGSGSVWFEWTAPGNGVASFDTAGTSVDSVLAVFSGRSLVSAALIAEGDGDPLAATPTNRVTFPITQGTSYHIAVASADTDGNLQLNWRTLAGGVVQFARDNFTANEESGSATITLARVGTATASLSVGVSFPGSADDTATPLLDYDATPLTASFAAGQTTTTVTVPLIANPIGAGDKTLTLTLVNVGGGGALGDLATTTLTIRDADDNPPNDNRADALLLTGGTSGVATTDNTTAGVEPGEPAHLGVVGGRSVWFRYDATANGALLLDTAGSVISGVSEELDTVLAVYTVNGTALTPVASNDNNRNSLTSRLILNVAANTSYFVAVDSREDAGQVTLNWAFATGGFLQFSQPEFVTSDDAATATISVSRLGATAGAVSATFATADNASAAGGTNYTPITSTVLNFADGDALKTFTVALLNNTAITEDKTFTVKLSLATDGAQLGSPATASVRIQDTPANDKFAAATVLAGPGDEVEASNTGARFESGEPLHGGPGGRSIWFKWRAPADGAVVFDTADSSTVDGDPLDTLLAAYTGAAVNALTRVASNDNPPGSVAARIAFRVSGGTTYYIAVDGRDGAEGDVTLTYAFSSRGLLQFSQPSYVVNEDGGFATITVTRTDAGALDPVSVTVAVEDGTATAGLDYDASGIDQLDFNAGETKRTFTIPILADDVREPDETILLTLSSDDALIGERSTATLTINDPSDNPANDNFATPTKLAGASGSIFALNTGAGREAAEPLHAGLLEHRSIWFQWTASSAGVASFDTAGSVGADAGALDTTLAVYTGTSLGALVNIAANDDAQAGVKTSRVSFKTTPGAIYWIAVDSAGDAGGEVRLSWSLGAGGLLQFRQPQYAVRENVGTVAITVDRIGSTTGTVGATWAAQELPGGLAKQGADFPAQSGTINLGAGVTSATFNVAVVANDGVLEGNETFAVTLSNPTGDATLSSTTVSTNVLIDDADDDPTNDNFASANGSVLAGVSGAVTGAIDGAGVEAGEPASAGGHTIWYHWTAPKSGNVQFSTAGSGAPGAALDTILTAFTGVNLTTLQAVKSNDDVAPGDVSSRIAFTAFGGTTYHLAVDARAPISGPVQLSYLLTTGGSFSFDAPAYRVNEDAGSVLLNVVRSGPNVNSVSVTYVEEDGTATAPQNYTPKTETLVFGAGQVTRTISIPIKRTAVGEQTFRVRLKDASVGADIAQETAVVRIFDLDDNPANDSFASAAAVPTAPGDASGSIVGTNVGAGRDAGEDLPSPLLKKLGGGRTVWFKWKAPLTGEVTFDTEGSLDGSGGVLDTVLAAFSGADVKALTLLAENDEAPGDVGTSSVTFHAVVGRSYTLVVDTIGDTSGALALNWSIETPAGDGPLLQAIPGFTPTVKFSEHYKETAKGNTTDGYEAIGSNAISATLVLPLAEVDISSINADTTVGITFGDFFQDTTPLSDDPTFKLGKKSASFPLIVTRTINDVDRDVKVGTVSYAWTAAALTIKITASGNTDYTIDSGFTPLEPGDPLPTFDVDVAFAGVTGHRPVFVTGAEKDVVYRAGTDLEYTLVSKDLDGTADYTPPTLGVTPPLPVSPDNEQTTLAGSAADGFALATVQWSTDGSEPADTDLTLGTDLKSATWTIAAVPLKPGLNAVTIIATDVSGNITTKVQTINRPRQAPITLVADGQGTISTSFTGSTLAVGQTYTVTAVPSATSLFRGWTGNDGSASSAAAFTFTMSEGLKLTARFIRNPFLNLGGNFSGFARSSNGLPGDTGIVSVDFLPTGALTGSVTLGTKKTAFSGVFDDDGNFTKALPARGKGGAPLVVALHLDFAGGSEQITGTVSDGTFVAGITADRQVFDSVLNPSPLVGKYTVLLSTVANQRGDKNSYLTLTVGTDGSVRFAGTLAGSVATGGSGFLSRGGVVQLYDVLSAGTGFAGSLSLAPVQVGTLQGAASWYRAALGSVDLQARGEVFVTPVNARILPTLTDGKTKTEIGGAGTSLPFVQTIVLGTDNKVTFTLAASASNGLSTLTFDVKTGIFTASGKRDNKKITAKGVILQKSAVGAAAYPAGTGAGYVLIGAP